jgi:predicted Zn-dependent protease
MIQNNKWNTSLKAGPQRVLLIKRGNPSMPLIKRLCLFLIILSFVLAAGCATNPVTHKPEIMLFSDQDEMKMGKEGNDAVVKQFGRYDDSTLQGYLDQVGQNIARVNHRQDLPYHYMVVDSSILNAFALPGGYIYINRGLLAYLNNEAQLASVLGHETGHVAARHGVKKYQKTIGAQLVLAGVSLATESPGLAVGTNLLLSAILQGYSRKDERQADELGALYMYRAGYDPREMPAFFKILNQLEKQSPNLIEQLFASHPPTPDRVEKTEAHAGELIKEKTTGLAVDHNRYISHLDGLVFGPGERDGIIDGNLYKNRYFRYQIQMPEGWKVQRGDTGGAVVAQDPSKQYLSQVIPLELKEKFTPRELAAMVEKDSGLQPYGASWVTIDGERAYRVDYQVRSQSGGWLRLRIAYITREKTGFVMAHIASLQEFSRGERMFNAVTFSFRLLSPQQAAKIPLHRLRVYMIKSGDNFQTISTTFYQTTKYADDIKQFNGMEGLNTPPVGTLIKIKPLLPTTSQVKED